MNAAASPHLCEAFRSDHHAVRQPSTYYRIAWRQWPASHRSAKGQNERRPRKFRSQVSRRRANEGDSTNVDTHQAVRGNQLRWRDLCRPSTATTLRTSVAIAEGAVVRSTDSVAAGGHGRSRALMLNGLRQSVALIVRQLNNATGRLLRQARLKLSAVLLRHTSPEERVGTGEFDTCNSDKAGELVAHSEPVLAGDFPRVLEVLSRRRQPALDRPWHSRQPGGVASIQADRN
jgi:hypothetical protein